ncbi:MAG: N-acetylmuramoyl-L-alanine amidase [Parvibaculaceae bacterium]
MSFKAASASWLRSPNFGERRGGRSVDLLLLHYTGMPSTEAACRWLCDPASQVSCHYLVDEQGLVTQMVAEEMRAWHAGISSWKGESDINSCSIGIEIANPGHEWGYVDFPEKQVRSVVDLCLDILSRHPIPPERVLAHSDVAPERKTDPGEKFPWGLFASEGIGHWVEPAPLDGRIVCRPGDGGDEVAELRRKLSVYGYGIAPGEGYDGATETVLRAFQRHFRPARVDGLADASTLDTLARLLATLP